MAIASVQILYRSPVGSLQGFDASTTTASAPAGRTDKQLVVGIAKITTGVVTGHDMSAASFGLSSVDAVQFTSLNHDTTTGTFGQAFYSPTNSKLFVAQVSTTGTYSYLTNGNCTGSFQFIAFGSSALDGSATHSPT